MSTILYLGLQELWCAHAFLRRPSEAENQEFSKEFMQEVYEGIVHLEPQDVPERRDWPLPCTDGDLWQITRMVPMAYMVGSEFVGKKILVKAMTGIVQSLKEGEDGSRNTSESSYSGNSAADPAPA